MTKEEQLKKLEELEKEMAELRKSIAATPDKEEKKEDDAPWANFENSDKRSSGVEYVKGPELEVIELKKDASGNTIPLTEMEAWQALDNARRRDYEATKGKMIKERPINVSGSREEIMDSFEDIYGGVSDGAVWSTDEYGRPVKLRDAITVKGITEKEYEAMTDEEKDRFIINQGLKNLAFSDYLYDKKRIAKLPSWNPTMSFGTCGSGDDSQDSKDSRIFMNRILNEVKKKKDKEILND